jgi:hypothetical protein
MSLDPPWGQYLALQKKLSESTAVDSTAWGFEAALSHILKVNAPPSSAMVERVAANESRRERYHAALRRQHGPTPPSSPKPHSRPPQSTGCTDGEAVMEARDHLLMIKARLTEHEWFLLGDVAGEKSYSVIAETLGTTPGALRVRVWRLREMISNLVAA